MTIFKMYGEVYQVYTNKKGWLNRIKLYIPNEKTGELIIFHDIWLKDIPLQLYEMLIEEKAITFEQN